MIEVIRMERKRLARVGGEEQENALEIFRGTTKKGTVEWKDKFRIDKNQNTVVVITFITAVGNALK